MFELIVFLVMASAFAAGFVVGMDYMKRKVFQQYREGILWQHRRQEILEIKRRTENL